MKVVVTGATSFIGAATVRKLLERGEIVYAVVRPGSRNLQQLLDAVPDGARARLTITELDLHQIEALPGLLSGEMPPAGSSPIADVWIHIGWDGAGSENRTKRDVQQANVVQSLAAVRTAAAVGCRRVIFTGSQAEYGVCHDWIREDTPCHPVSEYGIAKTDFAQAAKKLCKSLKIEYIHTRIFSVYGPGDHPWSLVNTCLQTWGQDGHMQFGECTQQWNFLYIEDVADALCHLMTEGTEGFYNLAGEDTRPLRAYIEEIYELCGRRGSFTYGTRPQNAEGPADLMPDIRRILTETSWKPQTPFAEGIRRMLSLR
jgi:nucleoside-diphosphate-sugar epimerase